MATYIKQVGARVMRHRVEQGGAHPTVGVVPKAFDSTRDDGREPHGAVAFEGRGGAMPRGDLSLCANFAAVHVEVAEQSETSSAEALSAVQGVSGWLTDAQARRVHSRARAMPPGGLAVEIGSFRGRSTIVLALGAPAAATVVAVDPHVGSDRGPGEIAEDREAGEEDVRALRRNLAGAGVAERVRHVRRPSGDALGEIGGPIDLLYVDGAHRYGPALGDIIGWGARVSDGGTMLVHDSFSSIGVTGALLRTTVFGDHWRYVGREGSLAEFRARPLSGRLRVRNALEQLGQLGWFVKNIALKVMIVLGLRSGPFPY